MKAKLIAYLRLCRPILQYANTLWDLTNKSACEEIEHVQNRAIRFIANLKGRCGISDAHTELQLKTLTNEETKDSLCW